MRLITLIFLLLAPGLVWATKTDPSMKIHDLGSIGIFVDDQMTGGCFTNIKEVRDYATGTIENKGGKVVIQFVSPFITPKDFSTVILVSQTINVGIQTDFNLFIIEAIKSHLSEW